MNSKSSPPKVAHRFFSERRIKKRILLIAVAYFLFFIVIIGRAVELHIADNIKLDRLAKTQYQKKIISAPRRGNIYDTRGEDFSIDVKVDSLYANPGSIENSSSLAHQLAPLLGMELSRLEKILGQKKKFVWIKRRLSDEESAKIQGLHLPALGWIKEYKRFYPNKNLAATVLGAVGLDSVALAGVELYYDRYLKSAAEPMLVKQDARGQSYSPDLFIEKEEPKNLTLTLDKTIQFITERELNAMVAQTQAKSGIAVVMNSRTGEVLAIASAPDFDPNQYMNYNFQHWRNKTVSDSFEPGSIFKAFTAAAALESGKISLTQKFDCENGAYPVGKSTIHDHGSYGIMTLPDIIRVSSNIGSFKIAQYIGREAFSDMVLKFGFGSKTGIDLPGEVSGIMASPKNWSMLQQGTIAFGQGISVTPIQVVTAYSAIANGGYLMKPFVVKEIRDSKGNLVKETKPQTLRQVMSEANAKILAGLLEGVIGPGGTGGAAQVEEYGVAGKTGTAQKVLEGKAGYADGKFIASFVGFAPAKDPRITVLVSIDEPKGNHFGGVIAAPVFREIVRHTLSYLGVVPQGKKGPMVITKSESKKPETQTKTSSAEEGIDPSVFELAASDAALELTEVEPGSYRLPNYKGKPLREVLRHWKDEQVKLVVEGTGLCVTQDPAAGKVVTQGSEVHLSFSPRS